MLRMRPPYPTNVSERNSHAYREWAFFITLSGLRPCSAEMRLATAVSRIGRGGATITPERSRAVSAPLHNQCAVVAFVVAWVQSFEQQTFETSIVRALWDHLPAGLAADEDAARAEPRLLAP
jgi:hypothetical protein